MEASCKLLLMILLKRLVELLENIDVFCLFGFELGVEVHQETQVPDPVVDFQLNGRQDNELGFAKAEPVQRD